jgi:hypothetical protein
MIYKTLSLVFLAITLTFSAPEPKVLGKTNPDYIFKKEVVKKAPEPPMSEGTKRTIKLVLGIGTGIILFSGYRFYQFKRLTK